MAPEVRVEFNPQDPHAERIELTPVGHPVSPMRTK